MERTGQRFSRCVLIALISIAIFSLAVETKARSGGFDVSIGGGAGYVPMSDWEDFYGSSEYGYCYYQHEIYGTFINIRVTYFVASHHAVSANLENIKTSASRCDFIDAWAGPYFMVIDWQFRSIPIGLSYEYYFMNRADNVQPYLGLGVSHCFTKVESSLKDLSGVLIDFGNSEPRTERGYHVIAYAGLKSYINKRLFVNTRLQGRYADGGGFTDEKRDIKINFSGVDLTVGVGFSF
ncbi:MAG: outer membrane beta-barrel protein [Candidatus Zixiibacteriota bacterium]|nr:MAG: outer membrane beta-barrel protein [candidate division Zixibacteria bacterium]